LEYLLSHFDPSIKLRAGLLSVTKDLYLYVSLSQLALSLSKACSEPVEEGSLTKKFFNNS
jgi:hypothetical protein